MKPAFHFPRIGKTLLAAALAALVGTGCASPEEWNEFAAAMRAKGYPLPDMQTQGGTRVAQASGSTDYARNAGQPIVGDITSAKALEFLYGKVVSLSPGEEAILGGDCMEFAPWKPPANQEKFREYLQDNEHKDKTMAVCKMLGALYTEQGEQKFALGTQAVYKQALDGGGLNFQPQPIIGAAIFVRRGGQWTLELEDKYITEGSLWGKYLEATTATLQRVGSDKHGILLDKFIHLGSGCNSNSVSLLMPYGGGIKEFNFDVGLTDDEMEAASCGGGMSVKFDTASSGEYYDAIVTQTIPKGNKEVKRSQRLRFQNGEYVKAKAAKKASAKKRK